MLWDEESVENHAVPDESTSHFCLPNVYWLRSVPVPTDWTDLRFWQWYVFTLLE
jgi:hypothetical protein